MWTGYRNCASFEMLHTHRHIQAKTNSQKSEISFMDIHAHFLIQLLAHIKTHVCFCTRIVDKNSILTIIGNFSQRQLLICSLISENYISNVYQ